MKKLQTATCRRLVFAIFVSLFAMACGLANDLQTVANGLQTSTNAPFATAQPTQNVICLALRGSVAVRNEEGRVVGWFKKNTPVCVIPERIGDRLQLADGKGTILAACVYGPERDCK